MKQVTIIIRALMAEDMTQAELDEVAAAATVQVAEPVTHEDGEEISLGTVLEIETLVFLGHGPYSVQRFRAKHDPNGNPRRVFVFRDGKGDIVGTTDEGYSGRAPVREFEQLIGTKLVDLGDADCSVTEYKELLRNHT